MKGIEYILPTLYFLRNLQIALISKSVFPNKPFQPSVIAYSLAYREHVCARKKIKCFEYSQCPLGKYG